MKPMEQGIDLTKQPKGTRIEFQTFNSIYTLDVNGDGTYSLICRSSDCGISVENTKLVRIPGSNWGGSALKTNWIGKDMRVEIIYLDPEKFVVTTMVQKLKIIAPDGTWSYDL